MHIKKLSLLIFILFTFFFVLPNNVLARPIDRHIETDTLEGISYQENFITTGDMPYGFDSRTMVYDSNEQLRSIRQLKVGQNIEMHVRNDPYQKGHRMVLDKIIILSK